MNLRIYLIKRRIVQMGRSALYKIMPRWLVREVMMYASRYIRPDEVVTEVEFMTLFERVCKE